MSSLTEWTSMRPLASCRATLPDTDWSEMYPDPPRHFTSPLTVSIVTGASVPSTSTSVWTPDRLSAIQRGAVIVYSTSCDVSCCEGALIVSAAASSTTWTSRRSECAACTRTAFCVQVFTMMDPPRFVTSRRTPWRTATWVSVCWPATSAVSTATVANIGSRSPRCGRWRAPPRRAAARACAASCPPDDDSGSCYPDPKGAPGATGCGSAAGAPTAAGPGDGLGGATGSGRVGGGGSAVCSAIGAGELGAAAGLASG